MLWSLADILKGKAGWLCWDSALRRSWSCGLAPGRCRVSRACLGPLLWDLGTEVIDADWSRHPCQEVLSVQWLLKASGPATLYLPESGNSGAGNQTLRAPVSTGLDQLQRPGLASNPPPPTLSPCALLTGRGVALAGRRPAGSELGGGAFSSLP